MIELQFADHAALENSGRPFRCSNCTPAIMKLRRCQQEREDFDENDDANVFPIQISKGGEKFNFCPAKSTWDPSVVEAFQTAVLSYEMKMPWRSGGMIDQPEWWRIVMSDFIPKYEQMKFFMRAQSILGDGKKSNSKTPARVQKSGAQSWQKPKT